jgi:hypothetical protein
VPAFGLRLQEALLQRDRDALGKADADEAAGGHRVAVVDQAHRLGRGGDLVRPAGAGRAMGGGVQVHGLGSSCSVCAGCVVGSFRSARSV